MTLATSYGHGPFQTVSDNHDCLMWSDLASNAECYPLGFDTFFVSGDRMLALPRSTRIIIDGAA